jgi:hypothetical protein
MPRPKPLSEADPLAPWRDDAACATPPFGMENAWVSDEPELEHKARAICSGCKVAYACLLDAMVDQDSEGIRSGYRFQAGGLPTRDRTRLRNDYGFNGRAARRQQAEV